MYDTTSFVFYFYFRSRDCPSRMPAYHSSQSLEV